MRRVFLFSFVGLLGFTLLSTIAHAGSRNPAGYPLRVHIFQFNGYSHYYRPGGGVSSSLDEVDGEGRANLYENGQPRGFDFSYACSERLMVSPGFETYLARWKKANREVEILLPVMGGKPGEMNSCDLKVMMKDTVYVRNNGLVGEAPAAKFKDWMDKHQYDPEHGKNEPVNLPAGQQTDGLPSPGRNGNSQNSQP
ncbi:MAG: hypothetical protein WBC92_10910 [Terracidiphilus sp.]